MTKRDDQKAATRAKMVQVATAAFRRYGYEKVTFRNLARAADVSTGAFFSQWASKAHLFEEVMGAPAPDTEAFLVRVATVCAGYPGDVGTLAKDAETMRRHLIGHHS